MKKRLSTGLLALILCLQLLAAVHPSAAAEADGETAAEQSEANVPNSLTKVDDSSADDRWKLMLYYPALFHRRSFTDSETGLYVHYNIYFPDDYDPMGAYPLVLFLPDSVSTGMDPMIGLTQGIGGLVWAMPEWQAEYPSIIVVPVYREPILDHDYGHTTSGYVELTGNLVKHLCDEYAVDRTRVYGTGQGMGCETLMVLASEHPSLFTACMFVSGQWDADALAGLENQKFIFFASEDDREVYRFSQKLMDRFAADGAGYTYSVWNADWESNERTLAALKLTVSTTGHYFVIWRSGTIEPEQDDMQRGEKLTIHNGGVHIASFNAAYRCIAVLEWLFSQVRPFYDVVK